MLSTIRNFALSFAVSLLIFGVSAYFLVGFIENNMNNVLKSDDGIVSQGNDEADINNDKVLEESDGLPDSITFLICGLDSGRSQRNEEPETDLIILMQINKLKKEFMFAALPCDLKTDYRNNTLRLGMVYSMYDIRALIECVKTHTALDIDFYAVIDYEALEKVFETVGEIEYNISMDMSYMPEWVTEYLGALEENGEKLDKVKIKEINKVLHPKTEDKDLDETKIIPEIDLKKGIQKLDYEKALQLLRYKDYSNGDLGRVAVAVDLCKEILRQKVTFENYNNAPQIFKALKDAVITNMTEKDLVSNVDLLFTYSKYTVKELNYPGELKYYNGNMFFFPNVLKGIKEFAEYRQEKPVK